MCVKDRIEIHMKIEQLSQYHKIYIFGAQSRAKAIAGQLSFLYPELSVAAYLVNDSQKNEEQIEGIPVLYLDEKVRLCTKYPVVIATKGIYHDQIIKALRLLGFQMILPVTVEVDNFLRNAYVEKVFSAEKKRFRKIGQLELYDGSTDKCGQAEQPNNRKACIYMARSIYDKPTQTVSKPETYERAIQAGAALTGKRLEKDILTDCVGDNISRKNRQYCELTVLYWIWKHAEEEILGLCHYRRHFVLPKRWQERMEENHVDVVLPVPTYVAPSIEGNYRERHDPADWEYLMTYLRENRPKDYETAKAVFAGHLYLPCNMFIMKKEILHRLCEWMFPIIDAVAEYGGTKEDAYLNRYPGFVSERLMTLYFAIHRNEYQIVYADKNFIS